VVTPPSLRLSNSKTKDEGGERERGGRKLSLWEKKGLWKGFYREGFNDREKL